MTRIILSRRRLIGAAAAAGLAMPFLARAAAAQGMAIAPQAQGLEEPWAVAFLPDGGFLVTERGGRLLMFNGGDPVAVQGTPQVRVAGQGGLLDVMVPRDFPDTRRLWLSFSHPGEGGASTGAGFGRLAEEGALLEDFRLVHSGPGSDARQHFGARLVEAPDGSVFLTTGDRGQGELAQDLTRPEGKVLHFSAEGEPLTAAEFEGQEVIPGLWSYGHRNIQGAALDAEGRLWTVEHGARGGDEVNMPQPGRNYGWPVITYGVNYDGQPIGEGTAREGMEPPLHYWDPSIAPSGLAIHSGEGAEGWRGCLFTGSLNSDFISMLDPTEGWHETRIETAETRRVRDVRQAPDGALWFLSVGNGALYRMTAN